MTKYGYFANAAKTFLVVKNEKFSEAKEVFAGTGIQIPIEGRRYLGGAVGSDVFVAEFLRDKVAEWTEEVQRLAAFTCTQPHAAFASFTHGLTGR